VQGLVFVRVYLGFKFLFVTFQDMLVCAVVMHDANFAKVTGGDKFYFAETFSARVASVFPGLKI